jgi:hypothetical protein
MIYKQYNKDYADLLLKFATAETSDDAGLQFIKGMKKAFNFPEKVRSSITGEEIRQEFNKFPTISAFASSLTSKERTMLSEIIEGPPKVYIDADTLSPVLHPNFYYPLSWRYSSISKVIMEDHMEEHMEQIMYPIDVMKKNKNDTLKIFYAEMDLLGERMTKIREFECNLLYDERETICNLLNYYFGNLAIEHIHIIGLKYELNFLFDCIINREHRNEEFHTLLSSLAQIYNTINPSSIYIDIAKDGIILVENEPVFDASFFINRVESLPAYCLQDYYDRPITYCLIELLKTRVFQERLKKCSYCNNFFASKTARETRFCSDKCRLTYHNRKYISSGKAREYKRKGRLEGKYQ